MKQFEKYGKFKWEFEKGEDWQYNCYFRFDEKMMATLMDCDIQDAKAYLALELIIVDYDIDYTPNGQERMTNPEYELQMWGFDSEQYYRANNLNHIRGVVRKYVEKLVKLIDNKNYNWDTYNQLCLEMEEDEKERKAKEVKAMNNKRVANWVELITNPLEIREGK